MFNKTSSYFFQTYGDSYTSLPSEAENLNQEIIEIDNKSVEHVFCSNTDIFIEVLEGIAMLVVSKDNVSDHFEQFVIHHIIRVKKNQYFNFFSMTNSSKILLRKTFNENISTKRIVGPSIYCERIRSDIRIDEILVYYYQVKNRNYVFQGEIHPHWELTFIDSGELKTKVDHEEFTLKEYDLFLYAPGQFHTQKTTSEDACSYLTVIFDMVGADPAKLSKRIFHVSRNIANAIQAFVSATEEDTTVSNSLCVCFLTEIIIMLMRNEEVTEVPPANSPMQQRFENEILNEIIVYINDNIYAPITIEQLCHKFSISRSSLQQLFKKNLNTAPKQYISKLKLKKARFMIKENKYTISEISDKLGFTSIHYFSRRFKQEFDLAPSDYAKTIYH